MPLKKIDKNKLKTQSPQFKDVLTIGRRKTAIARVKLTSGKGNIIINGNEIANPDRVYTEPLKLVDYDKKVDCFIKVYGGGVVSQKEAIRLGISRGLLKIDDELRKTLKVEGLLTRDPRMKERKKPGLKGARRAPQWQKR